MTALHEPLAFPSQDNRRPNNPAVDRKRRLGTPAQAVPKQAPEVRVTNWDETYLGFDVAAAQIEASRCIQCPAAPCQVACPLHNDIPGALWKIEHGDIIGAANHFRRTSNLPEVCGRVCPQEKLCEGSCAAGKKAIPVQIGKLESFAADSQRRTEGLPPRQRAQPTGRRVAIVGAGPAGLAVAEELAVLGHHCTVYDAWPEPGGVLLYGIPNFKLNKAIVAEKVAQLQALGVRFVCNTYAGRDISFHALRTRFDAVFLGTGAGVGSELRLPGEHLPGVFAATEFLVRANLAPERLPELLDGPVQMGERVVVIGGGDTAMDCVRTARRLGAREVTCVYRRTEAEMPGRAEERKNAREEGVQFRFLTAPVRFLEAPDGKLRGLLCRVMQLGEPDESGRRRPAPVPGSDFEIACDSAVIAIGYGTDPSWEDVPDLRTGRDGLIQAEPDTGRTSIANVFAGGDNVRGPDLVVTALAAGRKAAMAIDDYLGHLERLESVAAD